MKLKNIDIHIADNVIVASWLEPNESSFYHDIVELLIDLNNGNISFSKHNMQGHILVKYDGFLNLTYSENNK